MAQNGTMVKPNMMCDHFVLWALVHLGCIGLSPIYCGTFGM